MAKRKIKTDEPIKQEPVESSEQLERVAPEVKTYLGKKIISERVSVINEKEYISVTLSDGSVCHLSQSEYSKEVK